MRCCLTSENYTCYRCKRDKESSKLFSAENDMDLDPGPVQLSAWKGSVKTVLSQITLTQ